MQRELVRVKEFVVRVSYQGVVKVWGQILGFRYVGSELGFSLQFT